MITDVSVKALCDLAGIVITWFFVTVMLVGWPPWGGD